MKTKHMTGDSTFNDALLLPSGMLSIDGERKALRFHDGQTMGGYEILGTRAYNPPPPGPQELIGGDMNAGFFGEITGEDLITYEALATQIGLSAGVSQFNEESLWLKFALDGKILYVAKKPIRNDISWTSINEVGAVYEGDTRVSINGSLLDVTLIRGTLTDPSTMDITGWDIQDTHGSEWNRLMYPIHSGIHNDSRNPTNSSTPYNQWAAYSDADLMVDYREGSVSGVRVWCQEVHPYDTMYRVCRGNSGLTHLERNDMNSNTSRLGWRPCLRLVS